MTKKLYSVEWNGLTEICIEVDHAVMTEEILHIINNFFINSEERLEDAGGDITEAVLKLIFAECFRFIVAEDYGINHLINKFVDMEGYPKMDGSLGIRIVSYEFFEIDPNDISILIVGESDEKQSND